MTTNRQIDINCDMGEGMENDAFLMPYITSANIACGYHAGDEKTMEETIRVCLKYSVAIGAHPSFLDKENFGRIIKYLSPEEIYSLVKEQLKILDNVASRFSTKIHHVKPHGALYNLSAGDKVVAEAIANAVKDFDASLVLFGLSGSVSINVAESIGLKTMNEVFADRTYQEDGSLTPRTLKHALISNTDEMLNQLMQMVNENSVTTVSGKIIPLQVDTICIHGDGQHAVAFAKEIFNVLNQ